MQTTLERLTPVLRDVFDDDDLIATRELHAKQVQGWDSLGHIRLLLEIEKIFGLKFSTLEISSLKNLGELADLVDRKQQRLQ